MSVVCDMSQHVISYIVYCGMLAVSVRMTVSVLMLVCCDVFVV